MNKILQLFDDKFLSDLFRKEILPQYPEFKTFKSINIIPYKKMVWNTTYHVVIGFETLFLKANGEEKKILIVCSAHSDEPRKNIYEALKYLWSVNFPDEIIDLPRPLFYSSELNGTFYQGLEGKNLLYYIQNNNVPVIKELVARAGLLFARLHNISDSKEINFSPENSRIKTVIPGVDNIIKKMASRYPHKYDKDLVLIYKHFVEDEEKYFSQGKALTLIHGDAHPENLIYTSPGHLGLIDFTDLCLGDRARDLGTFIQQLTYKLRVRDAKFSEEMRNLFLKTYLQEAHLDSSSDLEKRIELYYNWTAIRTAVYWFLKFEPNEKNGISLLLEVKDNLKL